LINRPDLFCSPHHDLSNSVLKKGDRTMDMIDRYFDDSLRIYALCSDESLPDDVARLLSYMHIKACESRRGIDYFNDPSENDEEALGFMLGETDATDTMVTAEGEVVVMGNGIMSGIEREIAAAQKHIREECGMENRLSGELRSRMRLYRDSGFRDSMVKLYKEKIAPRLWKYDRSAVDRAFGNYRKRIAAQEQEFRRMLG
jgi:hypothetical protein